MLCQYLIGQKSHTQVASFGIPKVLREMSKMFKENAVTGILNSFSSYVITFLLEGDVPNYLF